MLPVHRHSRTSAKRVDARTRDDAAIRTAQSPFEGRRKKSEQWIPHKYQVKAIKFVLQRPAAGLFLKPGWGKTAVILHAFDCLKKAGVSKKLLVLAKLRIVQNTWPGEIEKWNLDFRYTLLHGDKKDARLRGNYDVYLLNFEGLEWLSRQPKKLRAQFDVLCVDESSKLKDTRTDRFKRLKKMLNNFDRRYILTGSPRPKSLMNLFGQVMVLDGGEALGKYVTHFRNQYFYPTGFMGKEWAPQPDAEERIFKAIAPIVLRLSPDLIKLPPLTFVDRFVDLPLKARKHYDEMEKALFARLDSGKITAANAGVATGKLRQICNGAVYDEYKKVHDVHVEKYEDVVELCEELQGEPALISYWFHHDLDNLRKYDIFKDAPHIGSKVSEKKANQLMKDFNEGRLPVLFGHPDSVAHGLNLQARAKTVIYFCMPWSLEMYEQFFQRVHRQGQKNHVTAYRIMCRNTIEDRVMLPALIQADSEQAGFLKMLEQYHEEKRHGST